MGSCSCTPQSPAGGPGSTLRDGEALTPHYGGPDYFKLLETRQSPETYARM
jgi:hypothetical protein